MKKGCLLGIGIILFIMVLTSFIAYHYFLKPYGIGVFNPAGIEINKEKYPITGIDISKHTGNVDFKMIQEHKIDFIYMKATEGVDHLDKRFNINYNNAKKLDLVIGAYHFFRFNKSGKEQAQHFLKNVEGKELDLPLVLDIEEWGNKTNLKIEDVQMEIQNFIHEIQKEKINDLIIYTNESTYKKYIRDLLKNHEIWICSFSKSPKIDAKWIFWQHSHKGKLEGAEGWIDINTFNGSRKEWDEYLSR